MTVTRPTGHELDAPPWSRVEGTLLPLPGDETGTFQGVQNRIEGSLLELEGVARAPVDLA